MQALEELKPGLIEAFKKARVNLVNYRKILLTTGPDEVDSPVFHYKWSEDLLFGIAHQAKEGFRESAKSQYIIRAFCLYSLTFPSEKRDYIVIIKKNANLAWKKLKEIEREYTTNPAISGNCVKIQEQSNQIFAVDVKDDNGKTINVRIEAYGKGEAIRGLSNLDRRPKIVILDDPQDLEEVKSETVCESDWEWFLSDVMFLGQHTRIFIIGNNLGEKCILERIFVHAGKLEKIRFEIEKVKQITEKGESSWPQKYSLEKILKEKEDYRQLGKIDIWLREKMCEATSEETRQFNREDYRYFNPVRIPDLIRGCNIEATLDPASSKDPSSCYRAIAVNAIDYQNIWKIIDVPYGRWGSDELIDKIFETVVKWRLKRFGIEKGIFKQVIEPFIYKEMTRRNIFFNIVELEHGKQGTKLERIKMLAPRFKAHTIWFPDYAPWLTEMEAELAGVTKDGLKALFNDLIDALAMQEQIAQAPYSPEGVTEAELANYREAID